MWNRKRCFPIIIWYHNKSGGRSTVLIPQNQTELVRTTNTFISKWVGPWSSPQTFLWGFLKHPDQFYRLIHQATLFPSTQGSNYNMGFKVLDFQFPNRRDLSAQKLCYLKFQIRSSMWKWVPNQLGTYQLVSSLKW